MVASNERSSERSTVIFFAGLKRIAEELEPSKYPFNVFYHAVKLNHLILVLRYSDTQFLIWIIVNQFDKKWSPRKTLSVRNVFANMLLVLRKTLRRSIVEYGITDLIGFRKISNDEWEILISNYRKIMALHVVT